MLTLRHIALQRKEAGDTIIEVLVAIAVVSLVLVGAYASTSRNVATTQDTQEHAVADQLVEGQIEVLRSKAATLGTFQCFTGTTPSNSCTVTPDGANAANYKLSITLNANVYAVTAQWLGLTGNTDTVTIYYRLG